MQIILEDASILYDKFNLAVAVETDYKMTDIQNPRIGLVFDNGEDSRRLLIPGPVVKVSQDRENMGTIYGNYIFTLPNIFYDCKWNSCQLRFEIEINGQSYCDIPVSFRDNRKSDVLTISEDGKLILETEEIDCRIPKYPDGLAAIPAVILKLFNVFFGLILIPWYLIYGLGVIFLNIDDEKNLEESFPKNLIQYALRRYLYAGGNIRGMEGVKESFLKTMYWFYSIFNRSPRKVLFLSNRREDMTGNFEYIYNYLKDRQVALNFWLHPSDEIKEVSFKKLNELALATATAKIILVDDFVPYLSRMHIHRRTRIMQLWHACGAFKTFGFTRLGKKGGPKQTDVVHRIYSDVFVSSDPVRKYYAEGFGVPEEKVHSFGIPRTDPLFDEKSRMEVRERIYKKYPTLRDKTVILFAPTFRGNGKVTAYYDKDRFDPNYLAKELGENYAIIIKHHPFVRLKYTIDDEFRERIFDFSDKDEINDLMHVADLVITDYSSVVYEASILGIPMLFYAYDLETYTAMRDFYPVYEHFVPGRIVRSQEEIITSIQNEDYQQEKVETFFRQNFDSKDGKSSERIAEYICQNC